MKTVEKMWAGAAFGVLVVAGAIGISTAATPPAVAPPGSTLDQRVAQRKAEQAITLAKPDSDRIVNSCVAAQAKLRAIQTAEVPILDNRTTVYGKIDAKLWIAVGQLKLAGKDSFPLERQHQAYVDKTANFQLLATNYKQAIDDAIVMNCKADPVGFKSMVETIRAYYGLLQAQSKDSRDYMVNTVKTSLNGYIADLQPKSSPSQGGN